jgi:hypothetical protein
LWEDESHLTGGDRKRRTKEVDKKTSKKEDNKKKLTKRG